MKVIVLDTSIYMQLGYNFHDHITFKNLETSISHGDFQMAIVDVVRIEFLNHFQKNIQNKLNEYNKIQIDFSNNKYLTALPEIDCDSIIKQAKIKFLKKLDLTFEKKLKLDVVSIVDLVSFCISVKESNKDKTRDYLIFKTLLAHANEDYRSKYIFISQDHDFKTDGLYYKMLQEKGIKNIIFYESIAQFLNVNGHHVPYINEDMIIDSIDIDEIKKEILSDIEVLPSFICLYYNNYVYDSRPKLQELKISSIKLNEYYTLREDSGILKVISTFQIGVTAIFEPEKRKDLRNVVFHRYAEGDNSRIDQWNRPIYDNLIFFVFEGVIDEENKKIKSQKIDDWAPNSSYADEENTLNFN